MTPDSLRRLLDEKFLADFGIIGGARALHWALDRSDAVHAIRSDLASGVLSESRIRGSVSELLTGFRPGQLFPYDLTLAAIAVALERRATKFTEEYLRDLACLDLAEMPMAIRVAREAGKVHAQWPGNKTVEFHPISPARSEWRLTPRAVQPPASEMERNFEIGAA
jgi:hypothetical protein